MSCENGIFCDCDVYCPTAKPIGPPRDLGSAAFIADVTRRIDEHVRRGFDVVMPDGAIDNLSNRAARELVAAEIPH